MSNYAEKWKIRGKGEVSPCATYAILKTYANIFLPALVMADLGLTLTLQNNALMSWAYLEWVIVAWKWILRLEMAKIWRGEKLTVHFVGHIA